jgi:signal transduction histidine kinase
MPSAADADPPVDLLRTKYAELARKYAQVVERLERRATLELAAYRVAVLDTHVAATAIAIVGQSRIEMSTGRFVQLTRLVRGPLVAAEPANRPQYRDLRALVLAESQRMLSERKSTLKLRYRDSASDALLSLHLERNVQSGRPLVFVTAEDITEHARRDQELARTREAMLHRERLRVLGELAASIAHDLGNTLRGASFQLALVGDPSVSDDKRAEAVRAVGERVEVASEAIARLHEFARTGSVRVGTVHLDRVVAQAAALVDIDFQSAPSPVRVRLSVPELPPVRGSTAELSLLFVNLLRNARDAMADGGIVVVEARRTDDSIVVTVSDEGTGIPPEVRPRLFEPFFTTKGQRGTGLGLWLAAGTMQRLGGTIEVSNRPRGGVVVALSFPLRDLNPVDQLSVKRPTARPRGRFAPGSRPRPRARRAGSRT